MRFSSVSRHEVCQAFSRDTSFLFSAQSQFHSFGLAQFRPQFQDLLILRLLGERFALGPSLADANNGEEPGPPRGQRLGPDLGVGFLVQGAPFGMAEDHSARTGVRLIGPAPRWARTDGGEAGLHPSNLHDNAYAIGAIDFTGDMPIILGPDGPSLGGFVCPAVIAVAESIPFIELTGWDHERLYALKGQVVAAGVKAVTGFDMPIFPKRRFQHGAADSQRFAGIFPASAMAYRQIFEKIHECDAAARG